MAGPELTPDVSGNPRVEVFFDPDDLDPATVRLRMYRFSDDRTWLVRGGVDVAPGVAALDWECPFQAEVTYRAEMFNAAGASLGFSEFSSITLDYTGTVVHQPLAPSLWAPMTILDESGSSLVRPAVGSRQHTEGSVVATWVGSQRGGLADVPVSLGAETVDAANVFQAMLGTYEQRQVPVLCIRTSDGIRWPRTFFAQGDLAEVDFDVRFGGELIRFDGSMTEVKPPFPGLAAPLLTYDDLDAFGDYDVQDANWPTTTDRDRAYELAGLAG